MTERTGRSQGRPPKTIEEKRRLGNPGKRPLPDSSNLVALPGIRPGEAPEPVRPLGREGRALWDRIWNAGAVWLGLKVDAEVILLLCEQTDERMALRLHVFQYPNDWLSRRALRVLDQQVMTNLALIGFNPVDRARLGVAEVKAADPSEEFFGRRTTRGS